VRRDAALILEPIEGALDDVAHLVARDGASGPGTGLDVLFAAWPMQEQSGRGMTGGRGRRRSAPPPFLLDHRPTAVDLAVTTRTAMQTCYARWLVWLASTEPEALPLPMDERATCTR